MPERSVAQPDGHAPRAIARKHRLGQILASVCVAMTSASLVNTPFALADSASSLKDAVTSARDGLSCGSLRNDPVAERVAEVINQSTDAYLDQTASRVPILDPLEGLKNLGYHGTKAYLLQGADKTDALAIKGALLEGFDAIPDCRYTDFGTDLRRNTTTGYVLASVVLAGA